MGIIQEGCWHASPQVHFDFTAIAWLSFSGFALRLRGARLPAYFLTAGHFLAGLQHLRAADVFGHLAGDVAAMTAIAETKHDTFKTAD